MTEYRFLHRDRFEEHAQAMFDILADNMNKIAPTGCSREEDYALWHSSMTDNLRDDRRRVVLALADGALAGYLQYSVAGDLLMMEEIEIREDKQGSGVFRALFDALTANVEGIAYVEAYANKANEKSIGILGRMGLKAIGTNKSGRSWHFRGSYADLLLWHSKGKTQ